VDYGIGGFGVKVDEERRRLGRRLLRQAAHDLDEVQLDWVGRIPAIPMKQGWWLTLVPPFAGAVVRFCVTDREGGWVSVYMDGYDLLGTQGEPYWEISPGGGEDPARCGLYDVGALSVLIEVGLRVRSHKQMEQ
jgi:hypothetical protein